MSENEHRHRNARARASEDTHLVRRAVTIGRDEMLHLNSDDEIRVYAHEYTIVKSDGDYHCTCGEEFDGVDGAEEHLQEVRADG